jgi:flagellar basal body-associated protein FliL
VPFRLLALAASIPLLLGCYDAEALRKERQAVATNLRLEEIDLGAFRVALPHTLGDANDNVVDFRAFGQVSDNDLDAVKRMLETRMPQLRAAMLTTIREMKDVAFKEPKLDTLRKSIAQVVNNQLETPAIKSVGFYNFTFRTM